MKGYLIANVDVQDDAAYEEYRRRTPDIIARYGGRFLVRGPQPIRLEGRDWVKRLVILEFDSVEAARRFYESPEYQAAIPYRTRASTGDFIIVEGYAPPSG